MKLHTKQGGERVDTDLTQEAAADWFYYLMVGIVTLVSCGLIAAALAASF